MSNSHVIRCVWCGEPAEKGHPIVADDDGENYHQICLDQQADEMKLPRKVGKATDQEW